MNPENKPKRISFDPTVRQDQMISEIMNDRGYQQKTQVVYEAIAELHRKYFPPYLAHKLPSSNAPEDKVRRKAQIEVAKKNMKAEEQKTICEIGLNGQVEGESCRYYRYSSRKRYEQTVPLSMLDEAMLRNQYAPSKEKVEQLQAEGKTDY